MTLPKDAQERKAHPIARGLLDYFPDACAEVAHVSFVANEQHNPGEPMHWAKEKSTDEADALVRHLLERGTVDSDGLRHSAKVAWRGLALLQREIDAERQESDPQAHLANQLRQAWGDWVRDAQEEQRRIEAEKADPARLSTLRRAQLVSDQTLMEAEHDAETLDHLTGGLDDLDDIDGVPA